jgi:hypothetical protein
MLYTVSSLSKKYGISRDFILRAIKKGFLKVVYEEKHERKTTRRISEKHFLEFLEK